MNPNKEVVGKLAKYKENGQKDNKLDHLQRFAVHFDRMLYTDKDDSESSGDGSCCDYDSWYQKKTVQNQSYRYETMSSEDSRGEDFSSSDSEFGPVVRKQKSTDLEGSDSDKFVQKINKMAKRVSASTTSHNTPTPIATTSSQMPSTVLPPQITPSTVEDVPQNIASSPKSSQVVMSAPQQRRKRKVIICEESDEKKPRTPSQRLNEDESCENTHKTKRRKRRSTHSSYSEKKSLKRKSYSNEIFALQRLDITDNEKDNSLEPDKDIHLSKKLKFEM